MSRILGGRYRLSDFLASGDTGEVWHALDRGTDRTVAVKVLYSHLASDVRLADRLHRARAELTALWHPSIARLLDVVAEDGVLALVTDLVPGTDLARWLDQFGRMEPATAAAVAASIAEGLAAAHRIGLVHGDLKPSNVVVPPPGSGPARLTDFSLTLLVRAGRRYGESFEPPPYRAPEVTDGAVPASPSDVYALGVLLVEMLDGQPGRPDQYQELTGDGPVVQLLRVASTCLRHDPADRPSAAEVADTLRKLLPKLGRLVDADPPASLARVPVADLPDLPELPEPVEPSGPGARRRIWMLRSRTRVALVFVIAMAITLGLLALTRSFWGAPGQAQTRALIKQSGSPTSGDSAPSLPTAATRYSQEGGAEFVRYWFGVLSYAEQTGITRDLAGASNSGCADCQRAITAIKNAYDDGGGLRGGTYFVRQVTTNLLFTLDKPIYEVTVDRSSRTVLDGSGAERITQPGLSFAACGLVLEWGSGRWRMLSVTTAGCVN